MATRPEQPTHSNWDLDNEQMIREDGPLTTDFNIQDQFHTNDELPTDDEYDDDLYGLLLSPIITRSKLYLEQTYLWTVQLRNFQVTHSHSYNYRPQDLQKKIWKAYQQPIFLPATELLTKNAKEKRHSLPRSKQVKLLVLHYNPFSKKTQTAIERFYFQLFSSGNAPHTGHPLISGEQLEVFPVYKVPYEYALRVDKVPTDKFLRVPSAIPASIIPVHLNPPALQYSLSQQASHLLHCSQPIKLFEAAFRPYEINSIHQ